MGCTEHQDHSPWCRQQQHARGHARDAPDVAAGEVDAVGQKGANLIGHRGHRAVRRHCCEMLATKQQGMQDCYADFRLSLLACKHDGEGGEVGSFVCCYFC